MKSSSKALLCSVCLVNLASTASEPATPSFISLSACLVAKDAAFNEKEEAWAKVKAINQPLSAEFTAATTDHNEKSKRYSAIAGVCLEMERGQATAQKSPPNKPDDPSIASEVRELTGLLDGLGPTGGSVNAPVAAAVRQANLQQTSKNLEQLGGTLDQALADFRGTDFVTGSKGRPATLNGRPDPALGAAAATNLREEVAQWNREEAARESERQRIAALAAARAERQRQIEVAAMVQQRQAQAAAEAEQRASKGSGFWDILGTVVGVGLGVAIGLDNNGSGAQAMQSFATAQALANASRSGTQPSSSSCSADLSPEPPSTGNMCTDYRETLSYFRGEAARVRACGNAQLTQYYEEQYHALQQGLPSGC